MNCMVKVLSIAWLSLVIVATNCYAQKNVTGSYQFVSHEHVNGPEYGNAVPTSITIKLTRDSVIISQGEMDANKQEVKSRIAFAVDGKPVQTKGKTSGRKVIRSVKWSDDKTSFTTTSKIYKAGNDSEVELTRIDEYKLSADGHLQFRRRSVETITESWEDTATYVKQ